MAERNFFNPDWIDKIIEFEAHDGAPAKQWKITRRLGEKYVQYDKENWEDFERAPMLAFALFGCVNSMYPSESALMKIYMQIPYAGSEFFSPKDRAQQASPDTGITELTSLRNLTMMGCTSSPPLINWKRERQNENGLVPGGFIVYLVTEELPGKRLSRDAYWNLSSKVRNEIRDAFKVAFIDCLSSGIKMTGKLDTNLLWDKAGKKIYIVGFRRSRNATENDAWTSNLWLAWGFAKRRDQQISKMQRPLPPDILPDGSINEALWEL